MKAEVVYSIPEHCGLLAEAMDEEGRELIRAGWGIDVQKGLEQAYWSCPLHLRWTILLDGRVVGMFGCAEDSDSRPTGGAAQPDLPAPEGVSGPGSATRVGFPWLTTAPGIEKVKLRFIRQSRGYIGKMFERNELLVGYAHERNRPLLAWLQWCGFRVGEANGGFYRCVLKKEEFRR